MPNLSWYGSPNFTPGRIDVEFVVIHWMDGYLASADATFQDTVRQTSAHYGVEDDTIHQYVDEANTAWHAGTMDANQRSIGIEHSAMPGRPASDATYASTIWLITGICQRHGLDPAVAILPHQHFFATACPGTMDLPRIIAGVQAALGTINPQSISTTPQEDDMSADMPMTSKDGAKVTLQDLLNSIDGKVEEALKAANIAGSEATNAKNNAADAASRVSFAYENSPAKIVNFNYRPGTNLAGALDAIHAAAAPASVDVDALVARLTAELPAAILADLKAKL